MIPVDAAAAPAPPVRAVMARLLRGWPLFVLVLALMALAAMGVFQRSMELGTAALKVSSNTRLDLFASVVEARVRRLEPIPATVGLHPSVVRLLQAPSPGHAAAATDYLSRLNAHLGSEAVFVLDVQGVVRASSNTAVEDDSQLGHAVSERPYFLESLAGRSTRHFAIGSGGQPGYFAAHPIHDGASVIGVAAIKIGLDSLSSTWSTLNAPALVVDANQVVILSSQPAWRYTAMTPLTPEQRVDLQLSRIYGEVRLADFPRPLTLSLDEESQEVQGFLAVPDSGAPASSDLVPSAAGYLVLGRALDGMDWRVLTFSNLAGVRQQALADAAGGALGVLALALLALYVAQRRRTERQKRLAKALLEQANADLEAQVGLRTQELTDAVTRLGQEVAERRQTESNLREAQDELVHAGKMAVLGQLAASITHELTQPLGGIRTLAGNAAEFVRRGRPEIAQDNLQIVSQLVDQMAGIIEPLKGFSRKSVARPEAVDPAHALARALFLFQWRLDNERVTVDNRCQPGAWTVWCDANRLQQVLVNLVSNALDAMRDSPDKRLSLYALGDAQQGTVSVHVQDSGKGLSDADLAHMFQPFYTTKSHGAGLGLGLVICRDIAAEFGGDLQATHAPGGGACFVLRIPMQPPADTESPHPP